MKVSSFALFFSILVLWVSSATSYSVPDFLQCLPNNSIPSFPISEAIYTPESSNFSDVLRSYTRNLRFATDTTPKPLVIVAAMHESHVQATVVCAKTHGLEIRIRSGGHDYDGLSYVSQLPFVILDMFNLRNISIDVEDESAWVQAGATLGELYFGIAEKSKIHGFPAGLCATLGVGGHFSGGGYGTMMRKYGLSVDNILDAQIVNVNGEILDKESMGEDLFWAIRGGGGASFGVILSWKIKLVRVPETVTVFEVARTLEQNATEIVLQWQEAAPSIDEDLFIRASLGASGGEGNMTIKASFGGMFLGQTDRLLQLLKESFPKLGLQKEDCIEMSWVDSLLFWINQPQGTPATVLLERIPKSLSYLKRKSDYVQKPIPVEGLETIWKTLMTVPGVGMGWNPYGGRMSEIPSTATAFPHRAGNLFKIQYASNWKEDGIEVTNKFVNFTRILYQAMTPFVSSSPREAFLNYRDVDIGIRENGSFESAEAYGRRYFKSNFDRLARVKTLVDPDNFFVNEQSIPPLPSS